MTKTPGRFTLTRAVASNLLLLLALLFSTKGSAGVPAFILDDATPESVSLAPYVEYLEDSNGALTTEQVTESKNWNIRPDGYYSFGFTESTFWFRVTLVNEGEQPEKRFVRVTFPLLDSIEVSIKSDTSAPLISYRMGDALPFESRIVGDRNFAIPLIFDPGETKTLYYRVQTTNTLLFPLQMLSEERFLLIQQRDSFFAGYYNGLILFIALLSLFLFIRIKARQYFYYLVYVISVACYNLALNGLGYQFIWRNAQWFNDRAPLFFISLSIIFGSAFAISFLKLYRRTPLMARFLWICAIVAGSLCVAAVFMPYSVVISAAMPLAVVSVLAITFASLIVAAQGKSYAWLFFAGWVCMSVGVITLSLHQIGWIPPGPFAGNAVFFGSTLEIILVILAIAEQLHTRATGQIRQQTALSEENQAQNMALTSRLEALGRERDKLGEMVRLANRLDETTGALNVQAFMQELDKEHRNSLRYGFNVSLVVLDYQNLDDIQQSHGVGDDCLACLASIVSDTLHRPNDTLGHTSDHQLAILLPNTDAKGAQAVAARILKLLDKPEVLERFPRRPVIVRTGVASTQNSLARHANDLVSEAKAQFVKAGS